MEIGQTIYLETCGNLARRGGSQIIETKIVKVGRKYFTTEYDSRTQFFIESMEEKSDYSASYKPYLNKQDILDRKEKFEILDIIHDTFNRFTRNSNLSLDQLRRIKSIIEE